MLSGGDTGGLAETGKVLANIAGGDAGELQPAGLGPFQKLIHRVTVRPAGVIVADGAEEKLLGGEYGGGPGPADDVG